jgi:hypothetical protein
MNESRLDKDLKDLSKHSRPELPTDFNEAVWSKIQRRERLVVPKQENWLKSLLYAFPTPRRAAAALALAILAGWILGRVTSSLGPTATESKLAATVTGEIIDMACYFDNGASGPGHAECARMCIASGLPVGLKTKDGTVYVLIGKQEPPNPRPAAMHESLNGQLASYAAKIVTISGTIVSKNGMRVIENAQLLSGEALWQPLPGRLTGLKAQFIHFL